MKMFETVADLKQNQKSILATLNQLQSLVKELTASLSGQEQTRLEINKRLDKQNEMIREQETKLAGIRTFS